MIAIVAASAVVAWTANAAAARVTAEEYVQAVCDGIEPMAAVTDQLGAGVGQAADAYTAQPSQTTATAFRQALADGLEQSARAVDQATEKARAAGTPDVKRGAVFAAAIVKRFHEAAEGFRGLATQAAAIDVGSASRFVTGVKRVSDDLDSFEKRSIKVSKRDPAFRNVAAPLRPLVVFMTTDEPRCTV